MTAPTKNTMQAVQTRYLATLPLCPGMVPTWPAEVLVAGGCPPKERRHQS